MAAGQVGLEQGIAVFPQAGLAQQVGGRRDHGLALIAVGDLAVHALGVFAGQLHQGLGQAGLEGVLALSEAGQGDALDHHLGAVAARQRSISLHPKQGRVHALDQSPALGRALSRQHLHHLRAAAGQHIQVQLGGGRVGQHGLHQFAQHGIGLDAPAIVAGGQGLEPQAGGDLAMGLGHLTRGAACRALRHLGRQFGQQVRALSRRHQLRLVGFPRVVGQGAPLVGGQGLAAARIGQHLLNGAAA